MTDVQNEETVPHQAEECDRSLGDEGERGDRIGQIADVDETDQDFMAACAEMAMAYHLLEMMDDHIDAAVHSARKAHGDSWASRLLALLKPEVMMIQKLLTSEPILRCLTESGEKFINNDYGEKLFFCPGCRSFVPWSEGGSEDPLCNGCFVAKNGGFVAKPQPQPMANNQWLTTNNR